MKLVSSNLQLTPVTVAAFVATAVGMTVVNGFLTPLTQDKTGAALPAETLKRNGMYVAGVKLFGGGVAVYKSKNPLIKAMGLGAAVVGALELTNYLLPENVDNPFISGVTSDDDYSYEDMTDGVGSYGGLAYGGGVGANYEAVGRVAI